MTTILILCAFIAGLSLGATCVIVAASVAGGWAEQGGR